MCAMFLLVLSLNQTASSQGGSPEIAIVYTGEAHAMIEPCHCPVEPMGGVARRAHEVSMLREEYPDLLLLDGGGAFAKGIYDEYVQGEALDMKRTLVALKAMAKMGYDAVCLGDEEFGFGKEAIKWAQSDPGIQFVCCNIKTADDKPFVSPFITKKVGSLNVLITGVCTPEVATGDNWQQFEGLLVTDPVESVSKLLAEHKEQADVVIVLAHLNEENSENLAKQVKGIDIVFNSNRRTSTKRSFDVEGTALVNFDYQAQNLILARLKPGEKDASARVAVEDIPLGKETPDDPEVAALVDEFKSFCLSGQVKPTVRFDLYMMSYCPHSKSAFRTVTELAKEAGGAIDPYIYYIVHSDGNGDFTALHGEEEIQETRRRIAIQKTQPKNLVPYVACRDNAIAGTSWTECAEQVGIDMKSLMRCLASDYPQKELTAMAMRCERLRVNASPTLYLNNRRLGERLEATLLSRAACAELGDLSGLVEMCKDLPKCMHDYDCPQKEGKIARCVNPGKKDSECVYEDAVVVPVTLLYDEHAIAANQERIISSTKLMMPGLQVTRVEASTPEGMELAKTYGIDRLPGYIFGLEAMKARNFVHLKTAFEKRNDKLIFRPDLSGATILHDRPREAGKVDMFIAANSKPGLEGMAEVISLVDEGKFPLPFEVHHILYRDEKGQLLARGGLPELQEAQRQAAMRILDRKKLEKYIALRSKQPDNSYWEEPVAEAGFEPKKVKELASSDEVKSALESDAKLCEELRVGGSFVLLLDNREMAPVAGSKMLRETLEKLTQQGSKGTDTE